MRNMWSTHVPNLLHVGHCGPSIWEQLPGKHHDDGAPRRQQDVADRIRHVYLNLVAYVNVAFRLRKR